MPSFLADLVAVKTQEAIDQEAIDARRGHYPIAGGRVHYPIAGGWAHDARGQFSQWTPEG